MQNSINFSTTSFHCPTCNQLFSVASNIRMETPTFMQPSSTEKNLAYVITDTGISTSITPIYNQQETGTTGSHTAKRTETLRNTISNKKKRKYIPLPRHSMNNNFSKHVSRPRSPFSTQDMLGTLPTEWIHQLPLNSNPWEQSIHDYLSSNLPAESQPSSLDLVELAKPPTPK